MKAIQQAWNKFQKKHNKKFLVYVKYLINIQHFFLVSNANLFPLLSTVAVGKHETHQGKKNTEDC